MKKQPGGTKKDANGTTSTVSKGKILERIAALMHDQPNVTVKLNQRLPPMNGKGRQKREIDVLLTGDIAGYPIRMAIECKNEKKPIGSEKIDAFAGKLKYVGIPPQQGIFISPTGYTKGAIERATADGIKTLTLRGLTDKKLFDTIASAFQSVIYLLLHTISLNATNEIQSSNFGGIEAFSFYDEDGKLVALLPDLIWKMWLSGQIPTTLGEHKLIIPIPSNLYQLVNGKMVSATEITHALGATVRVHGLVVTLEGEAKEYTLINAANEAPEKSLIDVSFNASGKTLPVTSFQSEEELQAYVSQARGIRLTFGRIPLPRIIHNNFYWPPSERVVRIFEGRWHQFLAGEITNPGLLDFQEVEGTDLKSIWEPIWEEHPAGQIMREEILTKNSAST